MWQSFAFKNKGRLRRYLRQWASFMRTDCLPARLVGQKPNVHSKLPHHRAETMGPQYEGESQLILPARDPADMSHWGVPHAFMSVTGFVLAALKQGVSSA